MSSFQLMERQARKPVGPAHILWNIVADNDVFMQLKKSWNEDSDKNADKKRDKKRPGEHSLVTSDEVRLSKRKQQSARSDLITQSPPIGMVPWTKSKLYTNDIIGLHEEIIDLYHWLCPRNWEIRLRCKIVHQIKKVVKEVWPCAKVRVFGSTRTKLFLPTSDLDIVVSGFEPDVEWDNSLEPSHPTAVELLVLLRQALIARKVTDEAHSVVIDKAQVPIVKLTELRTKLSVDITFSAASSINAVKFVNDWQTRCFYTLRPLAFVLKQFVAHRELNEVFYGGLSSYGLILMLINFFQLHERGQDAMSRSSNLGVLLLEFLELYGINFNFRVVGIDPSGAGSRYARRDCDDGQQQHMLSVLDPFNKDNDVTRGSFAFEKVQAAFHFAYCELEALIRPSSVASSDRTLVPSILSSVMQVHPETVFHRVWAERAFSDFVSLYGSECDDKPMDWTTSDSSSDEGNCGTDSFENDDDKDGPHSRNSATMGPASDCGTNAGDAESSLSNYGDEIDDKSVSTSPSLFVKLHNGLAAAQANSRTGGFQPSVSATTSTTGNHLAHHHFQQQQQQMSQFNHMPNHEVIDLEAINELHRSMSLPPFNGRPLTVPKVLPISNAFLPPHAQQEMQKLLASAPRAVVIPAFPHAMPPPPPPSQPQQQSTIMTSSGEPMSQVQIQQQQGQQLPQQFGGNNLPYRNDQFNNNWNRGGNFGPNQWMANNGTRRNVSESSSNGPNEQNQPQPPQPQPQQQNSQLPRRFHNNMSRRGGNDRYGRMHSYSPFNGSQNHHHNNQNHHYYAQQNNNQQQNPSSQGQRMNYNNQNYRNQNGQNRAVYNNQNSNRNNYIRGGGANNAPSSSSYQQTQSQPQSQQDVVELNNSTVSDQYNPDEMLSMKIDRKKPAASSNRQSSNRTQEKHQIQSPSHQLLLKEPQPPHVESPSRPQEPSESSAEK